MDRREVLKRLAALGLVVPAMAVERTYFFGPWMPRQPPRLWGDSIHDDAVALQWYLDHNKQIPKGFYRSSTTLNLDSRPLHAELFGLVGQYLRLGSRANAAVIRYSGFAEHWLDLEREASLISEEQDFFNEDRDRDRRYGWLAYTPDARNLPKDVTAAEVIEFFTPKIKYVPPPPPKYHGLTLDQARDALYRELVEARFPHSIEEEAVIRQRFYRQRF